MTAKNKTTYTDASVVDFINNFVDSEQKKKDSFRLLELLQEWTGLEPKMWGTSIIGYGSYYYKYASGHEGSAPLLGFSPRKAALTLYVTVPGQDMQELLDQLGRYKMSKACIYIKKLSDIDLAVLEKISRATLQHMKEKQIGC